MKFLAYISRVRQSINGVETPVMLYGKNFEQTNGYMNFDAALALCEENDATLPAPNSIEENDFVRSLMLPLSYSFCWLGITDEEWVCQLMLSRFDRNFRG